MKLVEITDDKSKIIINHLASLGAKNVKVYNMDTGSKVIYNVEGGKEHVSISNTRRLPTWEEVKYVRYKLMKANVTVAQILPPKDDYVNVHENCFHLWEISDRR